MNIQHFNQFHPCETKIPSS